MDVKAPHAKIGELTLENDCLEGALIKKGVLSVTSGVNLYENHRFEFA